jgi:hypothetical protein
MWGTARGRHNSPRLESTTAWSQRAGVTQWFAGTANEGAEINQREIAFTGSAMRQELFHETPELGVVSRPSTPRAAAIYAPD